MSDTSRPTATSWPEIEALFHRALREPSANRQAWLRAKCKNDEVRSVVEQMIDGHEKAGSFLSDSPISRSDAVESGIDANLGRNFGVYRTVEHIASGGMGSVYRAVRTDEAFDKEVALKVIRLDLRTPAIRRYFERERRLLARLEHPFIARLIDGGMTPDGLSYIVMELVRGLPVDRFVRERRLTVRDRLTLYLRVCRAVAYAHRTLIVHGDLKPSNILINEDGEPRLLDFGLSRLVDDPLAAPSDQTRMFAVQGWTPRYSSPEQIRGEHVSTSTDVYSLGIVLYELLTGQSPFNCDSRSPLEVARIVCDTEPVRPSSALRKATSHVKGDSRSDARDERDSNTIPVQTRDSLRRAIRGDLDSIVLKAIEKSPARRYPTVEAFANDIERHLASVPVEARGNRLTYRASRFVARNRWAVAGVTAVMLALTVGIVISTTSLVREAEAHRIADLEASRAESINQFLVGMLLSVDPRRDGRDVRVVEMLDWAAKQLDSDIQVSPQVESSLRATIGVAYRTLGQYEDAAPQLERALTRSREAFGSWDRHTAQVLNEVALMRWAAGNMAGAEPLFQEALDIVDGDATDKGAVSFALTLRNNMAGLAYESGRLEDAEAAFRAVHAQQRALYGDSDHRTLKSLGNLALLLRDVGRLEEAESAFREVRESRAAVLPADHPDRIEADINYSAILHSLGRKEEALALMESALKRQEAVLGPEHPKTATVLHNLGAIYRDLGRLDDADSALRRALSIRRNVLGAAHSDTLQTLIAQAGLDIARNQMEGGLNKYAEALRIARSMLPEDHWQIGSYCLQYGRALAAAGRTEDAVIQIRDAYRILSLQLGEEHALVRNARNVLDQLAGESPK